ncbi:unnamed protein product [Bathycoccus prasinos]
MGDFIYFNEATWGTNFRLKLLYADTNNGFDQWALKEARVFGPIRAMKNQIRWSIVGHHNHKIIYDPAQPTNSGQGTSQSFAFTSGNWEFFWIYPVLDDEANSSSGKLVNGVRQWEWDITSSSNQDYDIGASHWIHFVPGTAEDNGIWYRVR